MNKIGFRFPSEEIEEVSEISTINTTAPECELPDEIMKRLIREQVRRKAASLAMEYIGYNNSYGESQLEKLKELKRSYLAMM